jgi:hypothetical protein
MKARIAWLLLAGLALVLGTSPAAQGQRSPYGVEEFNTYVETDPQRTPDPATRLQAIDAFLQKYPESILRAFVYPNQAQTAFQLQRYAVCMQAVDNFMGMDRDQVASFLQQSNLNPTQIDTHYFAPLILYTYSFLQSFRNGTPQADVLAARAAERARQGLELHEKLYGAVQPPDDPAARKQFEENKLQQEASFRKVLAFVAYRKKDYAVAARELAGLVRLVPNDPTTNYQLGLSNLQQPTPDYRTGIWHLGRSIALKINKSEDVREYLTKVMSAHQQVLPECATDQVNDVIAAAGQSAEPPAGWRVVSANEVNAVRNELTVPRIFSDLKAGGDAEHLIWLASCGLELPELEGEVLGVSQNPDNLVTLAVAVTQEASDAKQPEIEVKVVTPPEAKNLKAGDFIHFTGIVSGYQKEPYFQLKLKEGKVKAEDIPKPTPARRGGATGR